MDVLVSIIAAIVIAFLPFCLLLLISIIYAIKSFIEYLMFHRIGPFEERTHQAIIDEQVTINNAIDEQVTIDDAIPTQVIIGEDLINRGGNEHGYNNEEVQDREGQERQEQGQGQEGQKWMPYVDEDNCSYDEKKPRKLNI